MTTQRCKHQLSQLKIQY